MAKYLLKVKYRSEIDRQTYLETFASTSDSELNARRNVIHRVAELGNFFVTEFVKIKVTNK